MPEWLEYSRRNQKIELFIASSWAGRSPVKQDGRVWGEARTDLARIQDISIWPLMVAWPAGTVLGLFVASF